MAMVVCLSCKRIVWAYDHTRQDIHGMANMLRLPCPKCGAIANFDGWPHMDWEQLHSIAQARGYRWDADGECRWFGDRTGSVGMLVQGEFDQ